MTSHNTTTRDTGNDTQGDPGPTASSTTVDERPTKVRPARRRLERIGWWALMVVAAIYGVYAIVLGITELLHLTGVIADSKTRAVPAAFVVHAFSGGIALLVGPLQFNRRLRTRHHKLHRVVGRVYVGAIWAGATTGLWSALFFDAPPASAFAFSALAIAWFVTTTQGYLLARQRRFKAHREWMIRSFAIATFFIAFSFWAPSLAASSLPEAVSHPMAVTLSWLPNLVLAEIWIRRSRQRGSTSVHREVYA